MLENLICFEFTKKGANSNILSLSISVPFADPKIPERPPLSPIKLVLCDTIDTSVISGSGNIGGSSQFNPGQNIDDWSQHMLPDNYGTVI